VVTVLKNGFEYHEGRVRNGMPIESGVQLRRPSTYPGQPVAGWGSSGGPPGAGPL